MLPPSARRGELIAGPPSPGGGWKTRRGAVVVAAAVAVAALQADGAGQLLAAAFSRLVSCTLFINGDDKSLRGAGWKNEPAAAAWPLLALLLLLVLLLLCALEWPKKLLKPPNGLMLVPVDG